MTDTDKKPCVHVKTQADLDAALQAGSCIHVDSDAEDTVLAWQQANQAELEPNGEW